MPHASPAPATPCVHAPEGPTLRKPPLRVQLLSPPLGRLAAYAAVLALLASPALLGGCGDKTPPGEAVVMRACRICHGAERICADIGTLDRAGWEKTVDRMIAGGANVAPNERAAVIDWLATRKPGEKPLCP